MDRYHWTGSSRWFFRGCIIIGNLRVPTVHPFLKTSSSKPNHFQMSFFEGKKSAWKLRFGDRPFLKWKPYQAAMKQNLNKQKACHGHSSCDPTWFSNCHNPKKRSKWANSKKKILIWSSNSQNINHFFNPLEWWAPLRGETLWLIWFDSFRFITRRFSLSPPNQGSQSFFHLHGAAAPADLGINVWSILWLERVSKS